MNLPTPVWCSLSARESEIIQDLIEDLKLIQKQIENMMEIVAGLDW